MKTRFLKLDNPCQESWDNMKPNDKGNFCERCTKTVIDFTVLDDREIGRIMKKSNGNVCARVTKAQLMTPLLDPTFPKTYELPYSNVAAGLMIATSLVTAQPAQAANHNESIELVASKDSVIQGKVIQTSKPAGKTKPDNLVVFKGEIRFKKDGKPIENATVMFVSAKMQIVTHTKADGTFVLNILPELIDNDNVIRVTYENVKIENKKDGRFHGYDEEDYILTKKDMESVYHIKADEAMIYLGGMRAYSEERPIVLSEGKEIKYQEFIKAQNGIKSSCSLKNKDYMYFESEAATAIYGQKAKQGLYIITQKSPEKIKQYDSE